MQYNYIHNTPKVSVLAIKYKSKLCWGCQTNKKTTGGKITMLPGFFKFVCKECVTAARERKLLQNVTI